MPITLLNFLIKTWELQDFSKKIGIHPAIVAGMLQKELNEFCMFRKIVDDVDVRREVFGDE